jgi:hypothetical protein
MERLPVLIIKISAEGRLRNGGRIEGWRLPVLIIEKGAEGRLEKKWRLHGSVL